MPTATHEHVREKDEIAGKIYEQPLPLRFHFFDGSSDNSLIDFYAGKVRQNGFERSDGLACQRKIQGASRAINGVAFGHLKRFPECPERRPLRTPRRYRR